MHLARLLCASLLVAACAEGTLTPPGGKDTSKPSADRQSGNSADANPDAEDTGASFPTQVSGAFLVECAWGDRIDDTHAQIGCAARATDGTGGLSLKADTGILWQLVGKDGLPVDAVTTLPPEALRTKIDIVFEAPVGHLAGAAVIARKEVSGEIRIGRNDIAASLVGLARPPVLACLAAKADVTCVAEFLEPFSALTTLAVSVLDEFLGDPEDPGVGTAPLEALAFDGFYDASLDAAFGAGGATAFCDQTGIRTPRGLDALLPAPKKVRLSLAPVEGQKLCFYSFDDWMRALSGAQRLGPAVLAGPPRTQDGVPLCYFVLAHGSVGTGPAGKPLTVTKPTLMIILNPAAFPSPGNVDGFSGASLAATVGAHRCP